MAHGVLIAAAYVVANHTLSGGRVSVLVAHGLSSCGFHALERRFNSYGTRGLLLHGMWDIAGSGIKPVSPALAGGFLFTEPPGKLLHCLFFLLQLLQICSFL